MTAFPKIVRPAIIELVRHVVKKKAVWFVMFRFTTMLTPPAPLNIPQMSPTTSPQNDETLSLFLESFFAVS